MVTLKEVLRKHGIGRLTYLMMIMNTLGFGVEVRRLKRLVPNISLTDTMFTRKELEILYPLLRKGGILIIDDYGQWKGCRKAVDEFFIDKNVNFFMCDFSCRFMIKDED